MKVMLAATIDCITQLEDKYPLLGSPKLDGIRAIVLDGVVYSRNMKPIPNKFVQAALPLRAMNGWDGELIVGKPNASDCFRVTTSGVMSVEGEPDFAFYAFDMVFKHCPSMGFMERFVGLKKNVKSLAHPRIKVVPQVDIASLIGVQMYEGKMLEQGYEGVMLRSRKAPYKHGRSTMKEGGLMKLKQFKDGEAEVLSLIEQMENTNEQKIDELGRAKRSSHKAGKVAKGTLGALHVRDIQTGIEFDVGTGFDDELRRLYWQQRNGSKSLVGQVITYKYFPSGSKDKPRFPVFVGVRKDL